MPTDIAAVFAAGNRSLRDALDIEVTVSLPTARRNFFVARTPILCGSGGLNCGKGRELSLSVGLWNGMIEVTSSDARTNGIARTGAQPIALTAAAFVIVTIAIGSIVAWRTYTGTSPEQDRIASSRQLQARTAQASEQLVEKTKGLEATQQESIDQLQVVQDQLQTVRRVLAAQQIEAKRLSEQVAGLTSAIDGLRQSFASTQSSSSEEARPPAPRSKAARGKSRAIKITHRKRAKSRG